MLLLWVLFVVKILLKTIDVCILFEMNDVSPKLTCVSMTRSVFDIHLNVESKYVRNDYIMQLCCCSGCCIVVKILLKYLLMFAYLFKVNEVSPKLTCVSMTRSVFDTHLNVRIK